MADLFVEALPNCALVTTRVVRHSLKIYNPVFQAYTGSRQQQVGSMLSTLYAVIWWDLMSNLTWNLHDLNRWAGIDKLQIRL